jgi:hypothetical protein
LARAASACKRLGCEADDGRNTAAALAVKTAAAGTTTAAEDPNTRTNGCRTPADVAFVLAVRRGVRAHHWGFGDMPPQPDASTGEVEAITRCIRELQRANAID